MKPSFLLIGMSRTGSTSSFAKLGTHPDLVLPQVKEPSFFNRDENYGQGINSYLQIFDKVPQGFRSGEASTEYSLVDIYPETPRRIFEALPGVRIVLTLREPTDRARSIFFQLQRLALLKNSEVKTLRFEDTLNENVKKWNWISHHSAQLPLRRVIVESGNYVRVLEAYQQYFAPSQLKVLFFEDLKRDPESYYDEICDFLGLRRFSRLPSASHVFRLNSRAEQEPWAFSENLSWTLRDRIPLVSLVKKIPAFKRLWNVGKHRLARAEKITMHARKQIFVEPQPATIEYLAAYYQKVNLRLQSLIPDKKIPW